MIKQDGYTLAKLLLHPSLSHSNIPHALKAYEIARKERSQAVQRTSREAGDIYEFADEKCGEDRSKLRENLEGRMKWIWEFNNEENTENAKREFERLIKTAGGK